MTRAAHVRDTINLAIKCLKCGNKAEKPLAWLIDENVMTCGQCGNGIDLKSGDNGRRIQEVAHEADRLQAALTKSGQD